MNIDNDERLREQILNVLHKTESCDGCKDHYKKPHKCDMDLAAPRCAKRVRAIEKLFAAQRQALRDEVLEAIGGDEYPDYSPHTAMTSQWDANKRIRDELRAELRTAISTIFEGKGDTRLNAITKGE